MLISSFDIVNSLIMPRTQQNCYFHKNSPLVKFCTSKQCTLPLCQKCESVHMRQHQKAQTQPEISTLESAHKKAASELSQYIENSREINNEVEKNLKQEKEMILSLVNLLFIEQEQKLDRNYDGLDTVQEKLNRIQNGSLKSLIQFYSEIDQFRNIVVDKTKKIGNDFSREIDGIVSAIKNVQNRERVNIGEIQLKNQPYTSLSKEQRFPHKNEEDPQISLGKIKPIDKVPEFIRNIRNSNPQLTSSLKEDHTSLNKQIPTQDQIRHPSVVSNRYIDARKGENCDIYSPLKLYNQSVENIQKKQKRYYDDLKNAIGNNRKIEKAEHRTIHELSGIKESHLPTEWDRGIRPKSCSGGAAQQFLASFAVKRRGDNCPSFIRKDNHHEKDMQTEFLSNPILDQRGQKGFSAQYITSQRNDRNMVKSPGSNSHKYRHTADHSIGKQKGSNEIDASDHLIKIRNKHKSPSNYSHGVQRLRNPSAQQLLSKYPIRDLYERSPVRFMPCETQKESDAQCQKGIVHKLAVPRTFIKEQIIDNQSNLYKEHSTKKFKYYLAMDDDTSDLRKEFYYPKTQSNQKIFNKRADGSIEANRKLQSPAHKQLGNKLNIINFHKSIKKNVVQNPKLRNQNQNSESNRRSPFKEKLRENSSFGQQLRNNYLSVNKQTEIRKSPFRFPENIARNAQIDEN